MKKYFLIFYILFFHTSVCAAQNINLDTLKKQFPGENALVISYSKLYILTIKDKIVEANVKTSEQTIALTDLGISYVGTKNVYANSFIKNKKIEAKTLFLNEAGKYKSVVATNIKEKADMDSHTFFDDNKTTTISYPSVSAGSITSLQSTQQYSDARLFGAFYFSSHMPTLQAGVTVKVDKNIQIKYILQNCEDINLQFSHTQKGSYNYYTWTAKNLAKYSKPDDSPNLRYFIPHIMFYVAGYVNNKDSVKVLSSPKDLYQWYLSRVKNINTQSAKELKKISDSLVVDSKNEFEKVKKIFYWVQDNIKYIAFEDGLGGLVPREANDIYEKRYGDCKDMASIITKMLKLEGIKSYLTWIGTRDIPYKYSEIPSPLIDNHMIASYKDTLGKIWLLDATGKNADINMYTSMIQGKQALIGIDSNKFELFDVPIVSRERNVSYDSINVQLQNETITGNGKLIINGYPKIDYDYLRSNLTAKEFNDQLKLKLDKGNNTFNLDSYTVTNADNRDGATTINYQYKINNYAKSYNDETYFNFNLDKGELKYIINNYRGNIPLEFENTLSENTCVTLQIPQDYKVNYIPENTSYKNEDFGYTITYEQKEKVLIMKKYFFCNKLMIYPKQFDEWSKMLKSLNKSYNESIILKHK